MGSRHVTWERIAPGEFHCHEIAGSIASFRSAYQEIEIVHTEGFGIGLFLDGRIQHVERDEYAYSEAMVHPAMILRDWPLRRALCIGGGPGGVVREILRYPAVETVVQVEIDENVIALSRQHLRHITQDSWQDSRYQLVLADAGHFLSQSPAGFDLIVNDLSEPADTSPAGHLFSVTGLEKIKSRLSPGGMFVTWAGSAAPTSNITAARILRTVEHVFEHSAKLLIHAQSYGTSWLTVVASTAPFDPFRLGAAEIDRRLGERLPAPLRLYDGETHIAMFHLPKDVRDGLRESRVALITEAEPLFSPATVGGVIREEDGNGPRR